MPKDYNCPECGRLTTYLSWSRLRTHEECQQKGFQKRAGKSIGRIDVRNFFPGSVVDKIQRDWLMDDPYNNPGQMQEMVQQAFSEEVETVKKEGNRIVWKNAGDKDFVKKTVEEAVIKLEPLLNESVLPYEFEAGFRFENAFYIPNPHFEEDEVVILNGEMDVILRNPKTGLFRVLDLKITRDPDYWKHVLGQLYFYDLNVLLGFEAETEMVGLIQPLLEDALPEWHVSQDDKTMMLSRIEKMTQEMWRGAKAPRQDTKYCHNCEVKHACEKFKPARWGQRRITTT